MAWISGRVQSFLGPSRTARSASTAATEEEKGAAVKADASGEGRRERRLRASSIMAGAAREWDREAPAATVGDTAEGSSVPTSNQEREASVDFGGFACCVCATVLR